MLVRVARGEDRGAWQAALAEELWATRAVTLKEEGEDWVKRARIKVAGVEREVVLKRVRRRGVGAAAKVLMGGGRLMRQWRGAEWLAFNGFRTAKPLALVRAGGVGGGEEVLAMEALPGRSVLEHLAARDLSAGAEHAVAEELGRMVARLVQHRRFNRDHKPSNLLVTRAEGSGSGGGGGAEVAIIDAVAIRPTYVGFAGLMRMLAAMVLEPAGCGCPPTAWEMRRVVRAAAREFVEKEPMLQNGDREGAELALARILWDGAARLVEGHGDPTPRVNPLAVSAGG